MTDSTSQRLKGVFERFVTNSAELEALARGEPLLATLSLDSLALVHLVDEIEREFSVRFDFETLESVFVDFPSLLAFLASRQGAGEDDVAPAQGDTLAARTRIPS